jgi:hypothetical protein
MLIRKLNERERREMRERAPDYPKATPKPRYARASGFIRSHDLLGGNPGVLRGVYREKIGFAYETVKLIDSNGELRLRVECSTKDDSERLFRWLVKVLDQIDPLPSLKILD